MSSSVFNPKGIEQKIRLMLESTNQEMLKKPSKSMKRGHLNRNLK